jgi:hypothetical protein
MSTLVDTDLDERYHRRVLPEEDEFDADARRWWEEMRARTLTSFDAADRTLLDELLQPLVSHPADTAEFEKRTTTL